MKSIALKFTVITSTKPAVLSKRFALEDGKLRKSASANLSAGHAKLTECHDLKEFDALLRGLTSAQALVFGVAPEHPDAVVGVADNLSAGEIARTEKFFKFANAPGIMMLDHDGTQDGTPLTPEELREALVTAVPELSDAGMLWRVSASSGIVNGVTGEVLTGQKGQRMYIAVQDASLIPAAGKALVARLWAAGFGHIEVGKAGQALKRTVVDDCVWQASRLDFAGPPELGAELTRLTPESRFFGDPCVQFDLGRIHVDQLLRRKAKAAQTTAIAAVKSVLDAARASYVAERAPSVAEAACISLNEAEAVLRRAAGYGVLSGDFVLHSQSGETATVHELLENPGKWDQNNFADPLEPEYHGGDRSVARAHLHSGRPAVIRSLAHGGRIFHLQRRCKRIRVAPGERARLVDEILEALRDAGEVYEFGDGGTLARVSAGKAVAVTADWLLDYLERQCSFYRLTRTASGEEVEAPMDARDRDVKAVMSKIGQRRLPRLEAVVTAPTLRADGSVLDQPGYDEHSGLVYIGEEISVPIAPSPEAALEALQRLWEPVRLFPFTGPDDRAVALAAMLTATVRGSLPTAPGFAFDAPSAGSGKTLLAKVIGILATGEDPAIASPASDEGEMRKRLFASLLVGAKVILWDNLHEPLGGAAIDAFLTAPSFTDRVLGVSQTATLPNRALFLATGNNLRTQGDTYRRVLLARIDAKSEQPFSREFDFDPAGIAKRDRQRMVADALTIMRAHITAGSPRLGKGRTASFELWDDLVRQSVVWIAKIAAEAGLEVSFSDPIAVIARQIEEAPDSRKLLALLTGWYSKFGSTPVTVANVIKAMALDDHPLRDALEDIAGQGSGINPRILGAWISRHRARPHKGLCIEKGTMRDGHVQWIVTSVDAAPPPEALAPALVAKK